MLHAVPANATLRCCRLGMLPTLTQARNPHTPVSINPRAHPMHAQGVSCGYHSTGKRVSGSRFEKYGEGFGPGDHLWIFLDCSGTETVTLSFGKNSTFLGTAWTLKATGGMAGFPDRYVWCCSRLKPERGIKDVKSEGLSMQRLFSHGTPCNRTHAEPLYPHVLMRNWSATLDFRTPPPPQLAAAASRGGAPFLPWAHVSEVCMRARGQAAFLWVLQGCWGTVQYCSWHQWFQLHHLHTSSPPSLTPAGSQDTGGKLRRTRLSLSPLPQLRGGYDGGPARWVAWGWRCEGQRVCEHALCACGQMGLTEMC